MSISEIKNSELASANSSGSVLGTTVLGLAILMADYCPVPTKHNEWITISTQGTIAGTDTRKTCDIDLLGQINRIYDDILANKFDLDPELKSALYANLWDLYT